ncbi:DUF2177 family protein [Patescibacteria group bacterium]|nr:DUF2177 family protein [Patescibacteria group bacterium]
MFIQLYLIALPIFFAIDMLWLGIVAQSFYASQLGALLTPNVNWIAAISFYLLFIAGLVVFVIAPAVAKSSVSHALLFGAFFGLVAYATYDLTNLATLKDWPLLVTFVDMAWGTALGASVSALTTFVALRFF